MQSRKRLFTAQRQHCLGHCPATAANLRLLLSHLMLDAMLSMHN